MKQLFLKAFLRYLFSKGFSLNKNTDKASLLSLIEKLHPFCTDKDLIRLGTNGDGGYLVPNDLDGIKACFSPGVGELFTFEQDCLRYGMQVFLADKSVDSPSIKNNNFHFIKRFIGPITNEDYITMDEWVNDSLKEDISSDLLLQMDIEGHEYFSIINMSDFLLKRFRIVVIEFHDLDKLWNKEFFDKAMIAFQKILQNHICVHIHPNNALASDKKDGIEIPIAAEFTFIRNDRNKSRVPQTIFPHSLDFDSTNKETIILPKCWYSSI
jgi:hypothetical protein